MQKSTSISGVSASLKLHKMPSAKVCPIMKCTPDCTGNGGGGGGNLQCHTTVQTTTAIIQQQQNLRKQSTNSSCSSSTVTTTGSNSNNNNSSSINNHNNNSINNSINSNNSNGNSNCNSLSNSISLTNNLNSLNNSLNQQQQQINYDYYQTYHTNSNKQSNNCTNKCTKACCNRNTHLMLNQTKRNNSTSKYLSSNTLFKTNSFQINNNAQQHQQQQNLCNCSPATANTTGLRLHNNKCTDQCFINKSSTNQCCNNIQINKTTNQITNNSLNNQMNNNQIKLNNNNNTLYDHRLNQSNTQAYQFMLDNDKAFGVNRNTNCSIKYSTMAPDLNYNSNNRCSVSHVPSSSSSSSNSKSIKCATLYSNDHSNQQSNPPLSTTKNNNLSNKQCYECNNNCTNNKDDCCLIQNEQRTNRKNQNFKPSIDDEFNNQQSVKSYYRNQDKFNDKYNNDKYNNDKYNNDKYNNDKYSNDKYNNDKYSNDKYYDHQFDKFDRCPDNYKITNEIKYNDKINGDKINERCLNEKCMNEKCLNKQYYNERLIDDKLIVNDKFNANDKLIISDKQQLINDNKQNNDKQIDDKQLIDELTPYEKVMLNLKKRAKQRIERKEESNPYVGMYRLRKEIGNGNFSQVYIGTHCLTKDKVAIKVLKRDKLDSKTQKMLLREISAMDQLHHPNVIRLFEVIETFSKIYLVMEYAHGGELYGLVHQEGKLTERVASFYFAQIISAIDHLHTHNIIHRDIKSENIFFSDKSYTTVKIGDFGFANQVTSSNQFLNTYCGSPPFASPELFASPEAVGYHGVSVDLWALGVLLYFMVTGTMPFNADSVPKLKKIILEGEYHMPRYVSDECQYVIKGLLKHLPQNRLSIKQIKQTKFLQSRSFNEALPSYTLRKQKINSDQLLNTNSNTNNNLKASSTLQLISTNDCCKYAKRPVSDGENYAKSKKQDDNYKLTPLLTKQPISNNTVINETNTINKLKQDSEMVNDKDLSSQLKSDNCNRDSCKSIENQSFPPPPPPQLDQSLSVPPKTINSSTKLNLHYYNDQQYYPSQAISYQNKKLNDEESGVFKSENSPKISFQSIENINLPLDNELMNYSYQNNKNNQFITKEIPKEQVKEISKEICKPITSTIEQQDNSSSAIVHRIFNEKLSRDEEETLKQLKQLGITEKMLEENLDSGVKNSLIGIYRLILHNVIANRLAKEKEEYREIKRKKKLDEIKNSKRLSSDNNQFNFEENRLHKSVSNGQFSYEENGEEIDQQLISSKSNRMHSSVDGLEYNNQLKNNKQTNELDDDLLDVINKKSNQQKNSINNKDLISSDDELSNNSSLLFSGDDDNNLDDEFINYNNKLNNQDKQIKLRNHLNDDIDYRKNNHYDETNNKKRNSKKQIKNELIIKQNTINGKLNNEQDDNYLMKRDLIDTNYDHSYYTHTNASMIINTNNLESNLCKLNKNLMNDFNKSEHQTFKPYLNNYLEEEKKWKKYQKKKKKLKKPRSIINCCIF